MLINNSEYFTILENVKTQINGAQHKAVTGLNREQIILYWNIGKSIIDNAKWGNKFIDNLAKDIKLEFPNAKGYSVRNLKYMRKFAEAIGEFEIVQTLSAQLSWSHNKLLLGKTKSLSEYLWYADKAVQDGLVTETLKSPYIFDFIEKHDDIIEREIEHELVANIVKTLLELGTGFAFIDNQYTLTVADVDYHCDMLFYNTRLRCYVVVELKAGKFKPEYAGKLNFYLSAIDDMLRHEQDNPSIGIILCKERDKLTAEYALKDIHKPIGVSEYKLSDFVPEELADTLPSAEDIERRVKEKYKISED